MRKAYEYCGKLTFTIIKNSGNTIYWWININFIYKKKKNACSFRMLSTFLVDFKVFFSILSCLIAFPQVIYNENKGSFPHCVDSVEI